MRTIDRIIEDLRPLTKREKAELIKALADMISGEDDFDDFVRASESSTDFWDNSIDDDVWNDS